MQTKIEIPDDLRFRIEYFLVELDEALRHSPENRAALTTEISTLETDATKLNAEIGQLEETAAGNDKAASKLSAKETRLRQINSRLEELRNTLANLAPPTLAGAGPLIEGLTRFYVQNLPDAIVDFLKPLCPTRSKALTVAKLCDCYQVLHGLRNWSYGIDRTVATPEATARLRAILARALRGEPHLGRDISQTVEAAPPAQPENAVADSTSEATRQPQTA
jgi:hypothetical protein